MKKLTKTIICFFIFLQIFNYSFAKNQNNKITDQKINSTVQLCKKKFGIGLQGGFSGWKSPNLINIASVSFVKKDFPLLFTIGGGFTHYGFNGFSISSSIDYMFKTFYFTENDINKMSIYLAFGINLGYGRSFYYSNGEGLRQLFVIDPRLSIGYRYFIIPTIEIFAVTALQLGLKIDIHDAKYLSNNTTYGYKDTYYNFDLDVPIHMGLRVWF